MKLKNSRYTNGLLLILFLLTIVEGAVLTFCRPEHGLYGKYYENQEWQDAPHFTAIDTEFSNTTLREQGKKLPQESYSIEWSGYIDIPETGLYTFLTTSDDGSWLFIDDLLVVDNGGPHGAETKKGRIHLLKGLHEIKIRYFQIGGFAVLEVLWENEQIPRTLLPASLLIPKTMNPAEIVSFWPFPADTGNFWLSQTGKTTLPFLLGLWAVFLIGIGLSSYRVLREFKRLPASILQRCVVQPVSFAGQHLKKPQVWHWIIVVLYTLIIFLTLSYARVFSTYMMDRFGQDIFSRITAVTLSIAGIGLFLYFITLRKRRLSRLLYFAAIVVVYVYVLSQGFRDAVHAVTQSIGYTGEFLQSLDIYPIYAGEKVHFLEYGLLGLLLCKTLGCQIKNKMAYLLAIVLVYLVGMMDEGIQWALPNRVGEYRDIWINIVSGGLAILMVGIVIRPRVFQKHFQWTSLKPLCYTLAVALIFTGLFLQSVHGFGSRIFMPDTGTQFVSRFTEYDLLTLDKRQVQRFEGKLIDDIPRVERQVFDYEARRHHELRNRYYNTQRFFESYCEQEILKTYFRSAIRKIPIQMFDYEPEQFVIAPDPGAYVFYVSSGQELAITRFRAKAMWTVVLMTAALLGLLATFIHLPAKATAASESQIAPPISSKRFDRFVLRPLFGITLVVPFIMALYAAGTSKELTHTNLLILTLESSQPDYLSAYGYHHNTTPFFDELASEGVLFSNMITAASWTIPSLASMLTGVNPNVHGIDARGKLLDPQIPTLFEALEQHGYVIGDTSYTLTEPSINSVYKKTDISPEVALSEGRSEESYLLSWMEANKEKPFFGWVHFHTTHLPYRASPPYNKMFLEDLDQEVLKDAQIKSVLSQIIVRKGEVAFDKDRHTDVIRTLFTQTLRQQDAKVGKVLMKLEELGLRDNTLIVVTADHGDELMEHGFVGHASTNWDSTVYDDLIQIPLVIFYPQKLPKGKRIDTQVRMIDIMPTVLDILDIPLTAKIQGKSFLPHIMGETDFQETAFSETTPCGYSCPKRLENNRLWAVRTNEWKFISLYNDETQATRVELYNLQDDPGETTNVLDQHPEIAAQFQQELQRWKEAPAQFAYRSEKVEHEHYLDVDVEVRPIVLFPKIGTVVSPETHNKQIHLKWIGAAATEYLIEYEVGTGGYHMTGELEVVGNEQWFGPFPEDIWQALPLYNPWKFRIIPKQYPQYPSDWITFEMSSE